MPGKWMVWMILSGLPLAAPGARVTASERGSIADSALRERLRARLVEAGFLDAERLRESAERRFKALASDTLGASKPPATVTANGAYAVSIDGDFALGGYVFKEGYPFIHSLGGYEYRNTAVGLNALTSVTPGVPNSSGGRRNTAAGTNALRSSTEGSGNTAVGADALASNTLGYGNVAVGRAALNSTTYGSDNVAIGASALSLNTTGNFNNAVGGLALNDNTTGSFNNAVGFLAHLFNQTGYFNSALGYAALFSSRTGSGNTAIGSVALANIDGGGNIGLGRGAGYFQFSGDDNIFIANEGGIVDPESGAIRIGTEATHTATYIAGIVGSPVDPASAVPVRVDASGKLGTSISSRRYKEAIRDMGDSSGRLLELRPVSFRFRRAGADGTKPVQFGLIAEEVAEVLPELVVTNERGQPEAVRYEMLSSMLLNELQKQDRRLRLQSWLLGAMLLAGGAVILGRWRLG